MTFYIYVLLSRIRHTRSGLWIVVQTCALPILSGGGPLVRRYFCELVRRIGRHLKGGTLQELALSTNGTELAHHAEMLADAGVRRINVSLDTLDPDLFTRITRRGNIDTVLQGIGAAREIGRASCRERVCQYV